MTNKLILGLVAWGLSMAVLWGTWAFALGTLNARREVTVPIPVLAFGMLLASLLFLAGIVLLIGAMTTRRPPIVR